MMALIHLLLATVLGNVFDYPIIDGILFQVSVHYPE